MAVCAHPRVSVAGEESPRDRSRGPTGKRGQKGSGSSKGSARKQEENPDGSILEAEKRQKFTRTLGDSGGMLITSR